MARNRDHVGLPRMFVVTMATGRANVPPTIRFNQPDHLSNLHQSTLSRNLICAVEEFSGGTMSIDGLRRLQSSALSKPTRRMGCANPGNIRMLCAHADSGRSVNRVSRRVSVDFG